MKRWCHNIIFLLSGVQEGFVFPWDEKRDVKSGTLHDDTVGGVTELFQQDDMIPALM